VKAVALFDRALSVCSYCAYPPPSPRPPARGWSNPSGEVLRPLAPNLWVAERPFVWNGIDVGGKMAVVRLADGSLWVHSPVNLDDALKVPLPLPHRPSLGGGEAPGCWKREGGGFCQESEAMKRYCSSRYRSDSSGSPSCVQTCRVSANLLFMISSKLAILTIACKRVGNLPTTTMVGNPPPPGPLVPALCHKIWGGEPRALGGSQCQGA